MSESSVSLSSQDDSYLGVPGNIGNGTLFTWFCILRWISISENFKKPFRVASGRAAGGISFNIIETMCTSFGTIAITRMLELYELVSGSGPTLSAH